MYSLKNGKVWRGLRPIMDLMQTMPPYVYLVPAIALFGLGRAPALVATTAIAIPPPLRLTYLGISQVPKELKEVGESFGLTTTQSLIKIQIPSALPTIMTGVNQCIMWALGMVVLAGWIGAGGLGYIVWNSLWWLAIGKSFEGGLAVVLLAIILDRIFEGLAKTIEKRRFFAS